MDSAAAANDFGRTNKSARETNTDIDTGEHTHQHTHMHTETASQTHVANEAI